MNNQPVIVNMQSADRDLQRRMIDFCSGVTYALSGGMERVADEVFLLTPSNVKVSDEERQRLADRGSGESLSEDLIRPLRADRGVSRRAGPHRRPPLPVPAGPVRLLHPELGHRRRARLAYDSPVSKIQNGCCRPSASRCCDRSGASSPRCGWVGSASTSRCWSSSWWSWSCSSRCSALTGHVAGRPADGLGWSAADGLWRNPWTAWDRAASMGAMDASQSALDSLRTVEFRETLKGYHRDDVDEYLEKAAVEAEGSAGAAPPERRAAAPGRGAHLPAGDGARAAAASRATGRAGGGRRHPAADPAAGPEVRRPDQGRRRGPGGTDASPRPRPTRAR